MSDTDVFAAGEARIVDRGYRSYDGPRTGVRGAMRAVAVQTAQRALGIRRSIWAKLFPVLVIAFSYIPAVVFVGVVALFPAADTADLILPTYGEYYSFIIAAIMVFVAVVAPEVLCTDRRTGMLGVYLAAPLDRSTYLLAKAGAIFGVLSLVCLGPPLLLLIANVLQSQGPEGIAEVAETTAKVLASGIAVTLLYTGITMGVTSLTDRKFVAMAAIILLFLVSLTITGGIVEAGGKHGVFAWAPTVLSLEVAGRVHGDAVPAMEGVPAITVWGAWAAWTIGGFALSWFQLRRLPVTR